MAQAFSQILSALPRLREGCESIRETLLANLVMLGEIPAPTFKEERRVRLLVQRFSECGLQNCSTDELGNGFGIIPGEEGERFILVLAHVDTLFPEETDHTLAVQANHITGPGVGDNSLGLAVLASLPTLLEQSDIRLQSNVILMGASRSLGRGNLEGLRFFLDNNTMPVKAGVCVEGVQLGRLSFASTGMVRGDIRCSVPEELDWTRFGTVSAVITLNEVINRIIKIRLPRRPRTNIILGSVEGGTSYSTIPTQAILRFEARSDSAEMVRQICRNLEDIVDEVSTSSGAKVTLDIFARRKPGGIEFTHPLTRHTRRIMRTLRIKARQGPSVSELSLLIEHGIPAITVGLTSGERLSAMQETVQIKPMFTGVAQLIAILLAIDGGYCNED